LTIEIASCGLIRLESLYVLLDLIDINDGYVTSVLLLVLDKNIKATKVITIIISVLNVLSTNSPQSQESLQTFFYYRY